jgi:Domain of unknown function (DUF4372)
VDSMARSFSAWSHVVSMLFAQLTHAIGLNVSLPLANRSVL